MLVFRLEDRITGDGPFKCALSNVYDKSRESNVIGAWEHPGPDREITGFLSKFNRLSAIWAKRHKSTDRYCFDVARFGFDSTDQYHLWFRSAKGRTAMAQLNGVIRVYRVHANQVIRGQYQVVFNRMKAKMIRELPADYDKKDVADLEG